MANIAGNATPTPVPTIQANTSNNPVIQPITPINSQTIISSNPEVPLSAGGRPILSGSSSRNEKIVIAQQSNKSNKPTVRSGSDGDTNNDDDDTSGVGIPGSPYSIGMAKRSSPSVMRTEKVDLGNGTYQYKQYLSTGETRMIGQPQPYVTTNTGGNAYVKPTKDNTVITPDGQTAITFGNIDQPVLKQPVVGAGGKGAGVAPMIVVDPTTKQKEAMIFPGTAYEKTSDYSKFGSDYPLITPSNRNVQIGYYDPTKGMVEVANPYGGYTQAQLAAMYGSHAAEWIHSQGLDAGGSKATELGQIDIGNNLVGFSDKDITATKGILAQRQMVDTTDYVTALIQKQKATEYSGVTNNPVITPDGVVHPNPTNRYSGENPAPWDMVYTGIGDYKAPAFFVGLTKAGQGTNQFILDKFISPWEKSIDTETASHPHLAVSNDIVKGIGEFIGSTPGSMMQLVGGAGELGSVAVQNQKDAAALAGLIGSGFIASEQQAYKDNPVKAGTIDVLNALMLADLALGVGKGIKSPDSSVMKFMADESGTLGGKSKTVLKLVEPEEIKTIDLSGMKNPFTMEEPDVAISTVDLNIKIAERISGRDVYAKSLMENPYTGKSIGGARGSAGKGGWIDSVGNFIPDETPEPVVIDTGNTPAIATRIAAKDNLAEQLLENPYTGKSIGGTRGSAGKNGFIDAVGFSVPDLVAGSKNSTMNQTTTKQKQEQSIDNILLDIQLTKAIQSIKTQTITKQESEQQYKYQQDQQQDQLLGFGFATPQQQKPKQDTPTKFATPNINLDFNVDVTLDDTKKRRVLLKNSGNDQFAKKKGKKDDGYSLIHYNPIATPVEAENLLGVSIKQPDVSGKMAYRTLGKGVIEAVSVDANKLVNMPSRVDTRKTYYRAQGKKKIASAEFDFNLGMG